MRLQARAYMIAHGANPDAVSEEDFRLVMISLNDGLIGNKQVLTTLGSLTTGVFNYIRSKDQSAYKLEDIIGQTYDYIYTPQTEEQKKELVNKNLLSFIQMMPGANEVFNNG